MNWLRKFSSRAEVAWFWLGGLVFCSLLAIRATGFFQKAELAVYDRLIIRNVSPQLVDNRVVVCGMTEEDLIRYGHPLNDRLLALLLSKISAAKPCVIGLDLYRDLKEPRSGEHYSKLEGVLLKDEKIIAIERLGKIKGPRALQDKPDRLAFNNMPRDYQVDDLYRRAYLFIEAGLPEPRPSLALALTVEYLAAHQVDVEMKGSLLKLGSVEIPRLTPNAGGYVNLDVRDYEFLLDYKVPYFREGEEVRSGFPTMSFTEILESSEDEVSRVRLRGLEGKIVLVATNLDSVKDANKSPVSEEHRGVFQHAAAINQLLRMGIEGQLPMRWFTETQVVIFIGLACFGGAIFGLICGSPWRLAFVICCGLGAIGGFGVELFRNGIWVPMVVPGVGFSLGVVFVTSYLAYSEKLELGAMKSIFSRHVSTDVVDALWAERDNFMHGGQIRPQRVTATVFFTDLKNFSTTSEKMEPSVLLDWMNEFMGAMAPKVEAHGGMVNKFIGDAIMAVFGVPVARHTETERDADAVNAVRCALAMREELKRLNEAWARRGLPTTAMRIGINTGELVSGSFGSSSRLEFTVLGDTVNTGARLESAGKDIPEELAHPECIILLSDSTVARLGDRFETLLIGPMSLKGKGEKVIVYSVVAEKALDKSMSGSLESVYGKLDRDGKVFQMYSQNV